MYLLWRVWIAQLKSHHISCSQKLLGYDQVSFNIEWEFPSLQFYVLRYSKRILPLERGVVGELWKRIICYLAWRKSRSRATTSHLSEIITNNFMKNKAHVVFTFGKRTPTGVRSYIVVDDDVLLAATVVQSSAHTAQAIKRLYWRLVSKKISKKNISHVSFSL